MPVFNKKYDFVDKPILEQAFPNLMEWQTRWTNSPLDREVAPAVFSGGGPPEKPGGPSSHFKADDWIIEYERNTNAIS